MPQTIKQMRMWVVWLRDEARLGRSQWARASSHPPNYDGAYCTTLRASLDAAADALASALKQLEAARVTIEALQQDREALALGIILPPAPEVE